MTVNLAPKTHTPISQGDGTWKTTAPGGGSSITFASRTKTVSTTASGIGNGSDANPWTIAQAMALAVAGDVVGIRAGTYTGTQTAPNDGAKRYSPAFMPANSGTESSPIYFVAENFAALTSTNRTELRSGATVMGNGWPAFGALTKSHIWWYGIYTDEGSANNMPREDSAPVTFWSCNGGGVRYCDIRGIDVTYADNHSGVRLENTTNFKVLDNKIFNFRLNSGASTVNQAGILTYGCNNCEIGYNDIDLCGNNIFWKAGTPQFGMTAHHNIFRRGQDAFRIQLLTDTVRNAIYQNLFIDYGTSAIYFSQTAAPNDMPLNLKIVNNLFYNRTDSGGGIGTFRYDKSAYTTSSNEVRNNIVAGNNSGTIISSDFNTAVEVVLGFVQHQRNCYQNFSTFGGSDSGNGTLRSLTTGQWQGTYAQDAGAVFANPLLVNPASGDYKLQAGSPCLNAGTDILQLLGGSTSAPINMGPYVSAGQTEIFGVRVI